MYITNYLNANIDAPVPNSGQESWRFLKKGDMALGHPVSLVGKFVSDPRFGPAKIISAGKEGSKLEYFISPSKRKVGWASIRPEPLQLLAQTRAYIKVEGRWRVGRIGMSHLRPDKGYDYDIEFPNQQRARFPEEEIYCRCWAAHDDPTETLAAGFGETQFFHEHRNQFNAALIAQRSACRGLASFGSSRIELLRHQVDVARRVLEDPLQRYLLADEVGMGKTIEAGLIIRQFLLDKPKNETVCVLAPTRLVHQWRRELESKFVVSEFPGRVAVVDIGKLETIRKHEPSLLVIDEAHHLVAADVPQEIMELLIRAPKLLLLSATPALGQANVLLRLLRVIDPEAYRETTLEQFQWQIDQREPIGIFLRGLRPDGNKAVLRQRLTKLQSLFPNDTEAARMGERIVAAMESDDLGATREFVRALRSHIADVHRIHQRLIRTRRRDAADWVFRARGPTAEATNAPDLSHVCLTWVEDRRYSRMVELFESWRVEAVVAHPEPDAARVRYQEWTVALFEAIGGAPHALKALVRAASPEMLPPEWQLAFEELLAEENDEAVREQQVARDLRRYLDVLKAHLQIERPRIVVFGSDALDVAQCGRSSAELLGRERVMLASSLGEDADISLAFQQSLTAQLLFCGRDEEEGLNLHFVDAIVHLDLPFSPVRIEQRIGRVDRFGRRSDVIHQRVLLPDLPPELSAWEAWYEVLALGFHVFNSPIADVQFSLASINDELAAALFQSGTAGLRTAIDLVRDRLLEERDRLDNQHALDKVLQEEASGQFFEQLEELEADEAALSGATRGWLFNTLLFKCNGSVDDVFRVRWDADRTLLPPWPWAQVFKAGLEADYTFKRRHALRARDGRQPQLLRLGSTLMRSLERELRWDDRGTAFATWRCVPSLIEEEWIGFKLCYVVEARLPDDLSPTERNAIAARADGYFAPWVETLYIDAQLQIVSNPEYLEALARPYDKARDTNLGGKPEVLEALVDKSHLEHLCREVRAYSEACLRGTDGYQRVVAQAVECSKLDIQRRNLRLQQRLAAQRRDGQAGDEGIEREIALNLALFEGLAQPTVKLDAIGLFILSDRTLDAFHQDSK